VIEVVRERVSSLDGKPANGVSRHRRTSRPKFPFTQDKKLSQPHVNCNFLSVKCALAPFFTQNCPRLRLHATSKTDRSTAHEAQSPNTT
jgi:hypothetical protein